MSTEFFLRIIFMIILSILGGIWGHDISKATPAQILPYTAGFALLGALVGLLYTPYFTTRPVRAMRRLLGRLRSLGRLRPGCVQHAGLQHRGHSRRQS